jgi:hypothetical protein
MADSITLSIEELAKFYIENVDGKRHPSEIARIDRIGDDVTIKFITRQVVLEALEWVSNHCYGDKKAYLVGLVEGDIEENWKEEKKEEDSKKVLDDDLAEGRFDSSTYGDLQSPAAAKLRGSGYGSQSSEDVKDEEIPL